MNKGFNYSSILQFHPDWDKYRDTGKLKELKTSGLTKKQDK